jgi:UDP-glucose 4-epimerase
VTAAPATLVVGAGGLLGRHVVERLRELGTPTLTAAVPWHDSRAAAHALRAAVDALRAEAAGGPWNIAWCAGAGVVATSREALEEELAVFTGFLDDVRVSAAAGEEGAMFLASSAGGVYAGSDGPPFTEQTPPRPLAPYGEVKLAMEGVARAFAETTGVPVLIGRIANIYGPGQNLDKPQGLVSQLCKAHLTGQPLSVYVSLDTRRDYLYVGDCAELVVTGMEGLRSRVVDRPEDPVVTKIFASGRSLTIGALIGESTRLFRRRPRVVVAAPAGAAKGQVVDLRLRSTVWPELDRAVRTPLAVGMSITAADIAGRRASLR